MVVLSSMIQYSKNKNPLITIRFSHVTKQNKKDFFLIWFGLDHIEWAINEQKHTPITHANKQTNIMFNEKFRKKSMIHSIFYLEFLWLPFVFSGSSSFVCSFDDRKILSSDTPGLLVFSLFIFFSLWYVSLYNQKSVIIVKIYSIFLYIFVEKSSFFLQFCNRKFGFCFCQLKLIIRYMGYICIFQLDFCFHFQ